MNVCLYVIELLLNGWTYFDEIFCMFLNELLNGLKSQLDLLSPTRRVAQTGTLRSTMEIFVNKWFLLVTYSRIIGKNVYILFVYKWLPFFNRADEIKVSIKSSHLWFRMVFIS